MASFAFIHKIILLTSRWYKVVVEADGEEVHGSGISLMIPRWFQGRASSRRIDCSRRDGILW